MRAKKGGANISNQKSHATKWNANTNRDTTKQRAKNNFGKSIERKVGNFCRKYRKVTKGRVGNSGTPLGSEPESKTNKAKVKAIAS